MGMWYHFADAWLYSLVVPEPLLKVSPMFVCTWTRRHDCRWYRTTIAPVHMVSSHFIMLSCRFIYHLFLCVGFKGTVVTRTLYWMAWLQEEQGSMKPFKVCVCSAKSQVYHWLHLNSVFVAYYRPSAISMTHPGTIFHLMWDKIFLCTVCSMSSYSLGLDILYISMGVISIWPVHYHIDLILKGLWI